MKPALLLRLNKGFALVFLLLLLGFFLIPVKTNAVTAGDWRPGKIIDDSVFFDKGSMSVQQIQNFLNAKVPTCAKNHSAYSNQYPPPYTCLKDYQENTVSGESNVGRYNGDGSPYQVPGGKSAAQIIWEEAQNYNINPRVLIVMLQKEQSLVTDDWPLIVQYQKAMGQSCPDTAPCDPAYAGFYRQVSGAAWQMRHYINHPEWFNYKAATNRFVPYNPNSSCGGTNVYIENVSTAVLYNYTPYQPNQAALNNLYGGGDSCSAFGNRNFWRLYSDWFGSTQTNTPYAWSLKAFQIFSDPARTKPFTSDTTAAPGGKIYIRMKAMNVGNLTWDKSVVRVGSNRPLDRISPFYDSTWLNNIRPAQSVENTVAPGETGTFDFILAAPLSPGTYREYFNLVAENITWMNDQDLSVIINVVAPVAPSNTFNTELTAGVKLLPQDYLLSPDGQSVLALQKDGNLVLYSNSVAVWNSVTFNRSPDFAQLQNDGNFVIYFKDGSTWSTNTHGHPGSTLKLQTDGNLVLYDSSNVPIWNTLTFHTPDHLSYVATTLRSGTLYQGQQLETADRRYRLRFQTDGNLVLYSTNRALWSSNTHMTGARYVVLQEDGNLVIYDANDRAIWNTKTHGRGPSNLVIQADGNLVLYDRSNRATWNTVTFGQF